MLCTIVGSGEGLGAAIARRFGRAGGRIALVARTKRPDLVGGLNATGIDARAFQADAASEPEVKRAFASIECWAGETDVLIYNAAAMRADLASELTPSRLLEDMAINLGGALACVQAVLPTMKAKRRGTLIFTGGGLALEPYPTWTSLAAGKAALRAYSLALHKELAGEGIRVCVVAVCGIVSRGGPFDPNRIAEIYWQVHAGHEPPSREVVYLPDEADAFYNDPAGIYRPDSFPITLPLGAR